MNQKKLRDEEQTDNEQNDEDQMEEQQIEKDKDELSEELEEDIPTDQRKLDNLHDSSGSVIDTELNTDSE